MSEPWEDYASSGTTTAAEPGPWEDFEAESKPWEDFEPPTPPGVNYSPLDPGSKPLGLVDAAHEVMQIPGRYIGGKIAQRIPGTPDQPFDVEKSIIPWMTPENVPPGSSFPTIPGQPPGILLSAAGKVGAGFGQFVTSPQGAGEGLIAQFAPQQMAVKWGLDMAHGVSKEVPAAWEAFKRGDWQGVADHLAGAVAMGAGVGHLGTRMLGELKAAGIEPKQPPNAPGQAGSPPVVSGQPPIPPAATPAAAAPPVVVTPDVLESLFQDLTRNQIAREPGPPPIPQQVPADLIPPTEPAIPERPKPKPAKPVANFQDIDGALNDFLEGQGLPRNTWDQGERQQLHALVRILVDNVGGASRRMILSFFDQPDFVMALKAHGLLPMDWEAKQRPQRGFGSSLVGITDQVPTNPFESMPIDQKKAIYDQIAAERAKNDREKRERVMRKIMEGAPIQREDFHSLQSDPHVGPMLASYSVSGNWAFPTLPIVIPPAQQKPTEGTRPEANAPEGGKEPTPEPVAEPPIPAAEPQWEPPRSPPEPEPTPAAVPETPEPLPVPEPSPGGTAAPVAGRSPQEIKERAKRLVDLINRAVERGQEYDPTWWPELGELERQMGRTVEPSDYHESTAPKYGIPEPSPGGTAVPVAGGAPKVKRGPLFVRPRSDGVPDILDDIQEHGGITAPGPDAGGEYDGYRESMVGAASMLRRRKGAGLTVDKMVEQLRSQNWPRVTTPDELWSAIRAAVDQRRQLAATGGGHEARTQRFWDAVQSPNSKSGLERINVQDLNVGDTFRIRGPGISHEELTVTHLDPDDMSIQVKDGPKLGVQDIPDGTEIWVKRGSHVKAHPTPTAPPPVPKLPWQMTKKELAEHWKDKSFSEITSDLKRWGLWREGADNYNVAHHRNAVAKAIKEGHPVPANVLADYPDLRPVPKLRQGERGTGDLLQGENAPFNLAGEKATDFERVQREKAAAEKTTREAKELEAKQQPTLPGADPIDEALTKAIDATNPGRVLGSGDVNLGLAKLPKWLTQEAAHGALKVVRATYRAGKKFAEAVEAGVQWLKDHGLAGFNADDVRNWLGGMGITESGIVRHAEMSKTGKATGANWKAELRNRPGVGKDEWALMSVDDLEDSKTYTRQEVLDYLRANEVQVKDVTLGQGDLSQKEADRLTELRYNRQDAGGHLPESEQSELDSLNARYNARQEAHFSSYQLPGAKEGSYREVLLTVPTTPQLRGWEVHFPREAPETNKNLSWAQRSSRYNIFDTKAEAQRVADRMNKMPSWGEHSGFYVEQAKPVPDWHDGHSQYEAIANPIVRLRFNERTTADGKRMLFLEEVQPPQKGQFQKMPALFQKQWREIAFKWALRHAAENGFDSVGWTTGEQQAARYSLSKQVDSIHWGTKPENGRRLVNIYVKDGESMNFSVDENGKVEDPNAYIHRGTAAIDGKPLEDVVGKEIAKRITDEAAGSLVGEGLDIGGLGLKKLYDTDFRNVVNSLPAVKKAGQKVGIETLETRKPYHIIDADSGDTVGQYSTYEEAYRAVADLGPGHEITSPATPKLAEEERGGQPVHSLAITPEMRESAQKFPHEAELEQPKSPIEGRGAAGGNIGMMGVFDPANWKGAIEFGRDVAEKVQDFGQWSARMLRQFGDSIRDHLAELWDFIKGGFEEAKRDRGAEEARDTSGDLAINPLGRFLPKKPKAKPPEMADPGPLLEKRLADSKTMSADEFSKGQGKADVPEASKGETILSYVKRLTDALKDDPKSQKYLGVVQHLIDRGAIPDNASVVTVETLTDRSSLERRGGLYDTVSQVVYLTTRGNKSKASVARMLAHESVHAALFDKLDSLAKGEAYEPRDKAIYDRLQNLFREAIRYSEATKAAGVGKDFYGLTNMQEFVAEALSRPQFQRFLHSIKREGVSLWNRLVNAISDLFGLSKDRSLLTDVLQATDELINSRVPIEGMLASVEERSSSERVGARFITTLAEEHDALTTGSERKGIGGAMQSAVERGGEAGAVRIPTKQEILDAMGDLPDRFRSAVHWSRMKGRGITDRIKRSGIYDFVSSSKDSADNRAKIIANSAGNSVRHALNRAFGVAPKAVLKTRNPQREMGLTMVVEAGGDRVKLAEMRNTLTSADLEGMPRIWKKTALRAIDFADAHWDKLKPIADMYQKITDWENRFENANGIPTLYRQGGYVFHAQDVETGMGRESTGPATDTGGAPAPFRHVRDHQTYADSIAAGVVPDSINAVDLLNKRIALGQRVVNYGEWRDALRSVVDPATEQPLVVDPIVRKRHAPPSRTEPPLPGMTASGEAVAPDVTAPPGYQLVDFGNRKIALHNGYTGLFLDLTAKSHIPADLMKGMSASKHWQLLVDTYHLGRLAFWNSTSRLGLPSYARGHLLLENSVNEIQKMVQLKEVPADMGRNLIESKQLLDEGLRSGLNVGSVGDNMYRDWIQGIPVVGTFNKWLFDKYQRGAMAEVYLIERQRMAKMYPELSRQELSRRVAKFVNTRFGNIQSQGWIKSRTGQDLARIVFLAPQWNETLIRSELGAVKDIVGGVYSSVKNRRLQMGPMGRAVGTAALGMFIANQLINYATRRKPTWENEEETPGAKLSAWVPDWIGGGPGFFLHPLAIPAEIVKHIQQGTARTGNWDDAVSEFLGGRFSSLMRGAYTFAANKTPMGVELKPGHRTAGAVGEALPMPIVGNALYRGVAQMVTGEHREAFPGQFQKQIMQSAGIKSEGAPDPGRRIGVLVSKFELARGIPMKPSHEESVYRNLTTALRVHNMTAANEALGEILKVVKANGETRELRDVIDYYRAWVRRPFTGSEALERQFVDGLNAAQKEVYDRARDNRERIAQQAFDLIDAHQP